MISVKKEPPTFNVPQSHCSFPSNTPLPHIHLGLRLVFLSIGQSWRHPRSLPINNCLKSSKLQVLKLFMPPKYLEHNSVMVKASAMYSSSHNAMFWQGFQEWPPSFTKNISALLNTVIGLLRCFLRLLSVYQEKVKTNDTILKNCHILYLCRTWCRWPLSTCQVLIQGSFPTSATWTAASSTLKSLICVRMLSFCFSSPSICENS